MGLVKYWDEQISSRLGAFSESGDSKSALISSLERLVDLILEVPVSDLWLGVHIWAEAANKSEIRKLEAGRLEHFAKILEPLISECQRTDRTSGSLEANSIAQLMLCWTQGLVVHRISNPRIDFSHCKQAMLFTFERLFV